MADHCCICLGLGDTETLGDVIVKGNSVCANHMMLMDERNSIRAAIRTAQAQAQN